MGTREVVIVYTNWKGETRSRRVRPLEGSFRFEATEWHPGRQWVFDAWDIDKNELRTFAMSGVKGWRVANGEDGEEGGDKGVACGVDDQSG